VDGYGECCSGGAVDACGVCGGTAVHVDAAYLCCTSGVLNAGECAFVRLSASSVLPQSICPAHWYSLGSS